MKQTPFLAKNFSVRESFKKAIVDFHATLAKWREFRQTNNQKRAEQLADLEKRGFNLKEIRKSYGADRAAYEYWLEVEQGVLPHLGGTVETTFEKLLSLYMYMFNHGKVKVNNQIRFTLSYLRGHYNGKQEISFSRVCINTLKNHLNKIKRSYASIIQEKYRGQLNLPNINTNCIVLTFAPNVIQFKNSAHTAVLSSQEPELPAKKTTKTDSFIEKIQSDLSTIQHIYAQSEGRIGMSFKFSDLASSFFPPS